MAVQGSLAFLYNVLTRIPFLILFAIIAVCAYLYFYQDRMIFLPRALDGFETPDKNPQGMRSPAEYSVRYSDISVKSADGTKLHTWFIKTQSPQDSPTVFFFQGNAGNMGFRLPNLIELHHNLNANIVAVSCRGYGFSEGSPSEFGVYQDAAAALNHYVSELEEYIDKSRIFLFGRSLGGAVALRLAHDHPELVAGVMVENTFYSMEAVVLYLMPPFRLLPRLLRALLRSKFDTGSLMCSIKVPVLFISGSDDALVPPSHLQRLYDECGGPMKWLLRVVGGTHNDSWQRYPKAYYKILGEFVSQVQQKQFQHKVTQIPSKWQADQTNDVTRAPRFYETLLRQVKSVEQPTVHAL